MVDQIGNIDYNTFSETLDCLKAVNDWQDKIEELGISIIDVKEINSLQSQILKVLKAGMGIKREFKDDEIYYYCYERNFGRCTDLGDVILDDKTYPLNSNKNLWELLISEQGSTE